MSARGGSARLLVARILAVVGVVLTAIPLVAPLVLGAIVSILSGVPRLDYLMPGELFPLAVAGGVLLVVAAFLLRRRRVLAGVIAGAMVLLFVAVGIAAGLTGLASGAHPADGWRLGLVATVYVGYVAAVAALVVCGVCLAVGAFRTPRGRLRSV